MADAVTSTTIIDSDKDFIVQLTNVSDGTGELNPSADGVLDFSPFGGLQNTSGSGKNGDINLTTTGHSSGDTYLIVLHCIKSYD